MRFINHPPEDINIDPFIKEIGSKFETENKYLQYYVKKGILSSQKYLNLN